jgi:hypothetical protein
VKKAKMPVIGRIQLHLHGSLKSLPYVLANKAEIRKQKGDYRNPGIIREDQSIGHWQPNDNNVEEHLCCHGIERDELRQKIKGADVAVMEEDHVAI